jgi:hypothetical protein
MRSPMQQRTIISRGSNARLDQIPDFVIAAAVKAIGKALHEIIEDRQKQNTSTISGPATEENHG